MDKIKYFPILFKNIIDNLNTDKILISAEPIDFKSAIWLKNNTKAKFIKTTSLNDLGGVIANVKLFVTLDGGEGCVDFDFSMLIPPFAGVGLKAYDKNGEDITSTVFAPNGFMKVDADYTPKPFEEWSAKDWPQTYQNPTYKNMFAAGIAFAPPHLISKPMTNPDGVPINPTPPRTGMPSGMIGAAVAHSIVDMVTKGASDPTHKKSMSEMGAACIASTGKGFFNGSAVSMTVFPVVPDYEKYPETGRDQTLTFGEVGLAGHWIKHFLHHTFIYKAKLKPLWWLIPE